MSALSVVPAAAVYISALPLQPALWVTLLWAYLLPLRRSCLRLPSLKPSLLIHASCLEYPGANQDPQT